MKSKVNFFCIFLWLITAEATSKEIENLLIKEMIPPEEQIGKTVGESLHKTCSLKFDVNDASYGAAWYGPDGAAVEKHGRIRFDLIESSLVIFFKSLIESDSGNWSCYASGNGREENKTFMLRVYNPTKFEDADTSFRFNESDKVFLPCEPNGTPKPSISWEFEGIRMDDEFEEFDNYKIIADGLYIDGVTREHAGNFICRAYQVDPFWSNIVEKQISLHVNYEPIMLIENTTHYAVKDSNLNFTCRAEGHPSPRFHWIHYNHVDHKKKNLTENTYTDVDSSVLMISVKNAHDFGKYVCIAENEFGKSKVFFNLTGGRLPPRPKVFKLIGSGYTTLDIDVGANTSHKHEIESFPVFAYRFQYIRKKDYENESSWENAEEMQKLTSDISKDGSYIIHELEEDTAYYVRVSAKNSMGYGGWTKHKEFRTFPNFRVVNQKPLFKQEIMNENNSGSVLTGDNLIKIILLISIGFRSLFN